MARNSPPTCPHPAVDNNHNADGLVAGHEYIAADRRGQDCFKLFRLAVPRVLAVFSMFNSALVLLCLATVYNDSVASLVLAAAAADAALVLDRVGVVPQVLRATRELSFMTRILLQSSLAAWGVLISMNGVICIITILLLQMSLPRVAADPAAHVFLMLATVNSIHGIWVTSCYYHCGRRLLAASSNRSIILRWALNLTRRTSCTFFYPAALLAVPAAASAWSIVSFAVSLILIASPASPVHFLSVNMRLGEHQVTVLSVLSTYAALSTIYYAVAVRVFVSLGADGSEDNGDTDIELEGNATLDGRFVAEPVRPIAEPC